MPFTKKKRIRVPSGIKTTIYKGIEIKEIKRSLIEVPTSYSQIYDGADEQLSRLRPLSIKLMHYLVKIMDTDNNCDFAGPAKRRFIQSLRKNQPRSGSIDNSLLELKKAGLIRASERGSYIVNPLYFTKGTTKNKRLGMVKEEFRRLHSTNTELWAKLIGLNKK